MGTQLWKSCADGSHAVLQCCGPTSGNTALSFAVEMNAKTIILIGIDFGQRDDQYHHSKHSLYHALASLTLNKVETQHEVAANFGGVVRTSLLLDKARQSAEVLISQNDINCINCSDGAFIQGTTTEHFYQFVSDIEKSSTQKIDKQHEIKTLLKACTKTANLQKQQYKSIIGLS